MADLKQAVRSLLAYTIWADRQVLESLATASAEDLVRDTGTSFGSILHTMAHLLAAEQIWLARFLGAPLEQAPTATDHPDLPALAAGFVDFWPQLEFFLASLSDEQLASQLTWVNARGETHTVPLHVALLHFANHSTFHRGQVVSMLRQLGYEPPATDLVYWKGVG